MTATCTPHYTSRGYDQPEIIDQLRGVRIDAGGGQASGK
jgi:hypothetical protein